MSVSQNDIARVTGLTRSTVSRALANHPQTAEATKKVVREAAKRLGYQKNAIVSLLTAQIRQSKIAPTQSALAYVTSFPPDHIWGPDAKNYWEYYAGAKAQANALGYQLDMISRSEKGMTTQRFNSMLVARGIRGCVIAPRSHPLSHVAMDYSRFAVAAVGHPLAAPHVNHASPWHFQMMSLALRQILKRGYVRLGYAILPVSDRYSDWGFSSRFALYQAQIQPRFRVPFLAKTLDPRVPTRADFEKWFFKHKPDVILCTGHVVPTWIAELGLKVPEDAAYADLVKSVGDPSVSGVYERPRDVGACAVDLVIEQLHKNHIGVPPVAKCIHVEGVWINGASMGRKI